MIVQALYLLTLFIKPGCSTIILTADLRTRTAMGLSKTGTHFSRLNREKEKTLTIVTTDEEDSRLLNV